MERDIVLVAPRRAIGRHRFLRAAQARKIRRLRPPSGHICMPLSVWLARLVQQYAGKECNMSILKSRELARSGKAEIEGNIRELVRQQGNTIRRSDAAGEQATNELSNLLREVSLHS